MKKILLVGATILMLIAALFILTGCGEETTDTNTNSDSTATVIEVPVNIVNMFPDTTITELYTTGAGVDNWGSNILAGQTMSTGEQLPVVLNVDQNNLQWDIKVVDSQGTEVVFNGLDLSNMSTAGGTITIQADVDGSVIVTAQ